MITREKIKVLSKAVLRLEEALKKAYRIDWDSTLPPDYCCILCGQREDHGEDHAVGCPILLASGSHKARCRGCDSVFDRVGNSHYCSDPCRHVADKATKRRWWRKAQKKQQPSRGGEMIP